MRAPAAALCVSLATGACGSSECDPTASACVYEHDFGLQQVASGGERDGLCQSWTLGNETEVWVNVVDLMNDGAYHHSNWFFVPDNNFEFPDGAWDCSEGGFEELIAAILGGVLFAQSTQSTSETQAFAPGVAVRIPPHSRIIGSTHLLNTGDAEVATGLRMRLQTLAPADLTVKLTPFRLTYYDLHVPPMSTASFTSTCDIKTEHEELMGQPFALKLHYVLPHFHNLGSRFELRAAGGTHDGETLYELDGFSPEGHGKTFDPPVDISDGTGFQFTCQFTNPRETEVGWGIGDQEMCVMLGFAETTMAFDASVGHDKGMVTGNEGGVITASGPCGVLGIPFFQDK